MTTLVIDQISALVLRHGFLQPEVAVAIALAESGGRTDAVGVNGPNTNAPGTIDRGLWQINSRFHPEVSNICAFDPDCCADAALRISSGGQIWTPWSTYNRGTYQQFMQAARESVIRVRGMLNPGSLPPFDPWHNKWSIYPVIAKPTCYPLDPRAPAWVNLPVIQATQGYVGYAQAVMAFKGGQDLHQAPLDGIYDDLYTLAAVGNIQRFFGLPVDYVIGASTWHAIDFLALR